MGVLTKDLGNFKGSIGMGSPVGWMLLLSVDAEGVFDVEIRASFGECTETCLVDTPLLVILSTHVTLCTVLMAFLLWCFTMMADGAEVSDYSDAFLLRLNVPLHS